MTSGSSQTSRTVNHPVRLPIRTSKTRQDAVASLLALMAVELILKISLSHRSARAATGTVKRSAHVVQIAMAGTIETHSTTRSRRGGASPLCSMSLPRIDRRRPAQSLLSQKTPSGMTLDGVATNPKPARHKRPKAEQPICPRAFLLMSTQKLRGCILQSGVHSFLP
jgi:hypothetical protein